MSRITDLLEALLNDEQIGNANATVIYKNSNTGEEITE